MALTYQPFAEAPEISKVGKELHLNVSDGERIGGGLVALRFLLWGVRSHGLARWSLLVLRGMLLVRGLRGRCPAYEALSIDTRHENKVSGDKGTRRDLSDPNV